MKTVTIVLLTIGICAKISSKVTVLTMDSLKDISKEYTQLLARHCQPIFKYFDVTQVHYVYVYEDGHVCIINTDDELLERYLDDKYYQTDLLLRAPNSIQRNLILPWNIDYYPGYKKGHLQKLLDGSPIYQGVTFIEKYEPGYSNFSFGTSKKEGDWNTQLITASHVIRQYIQQVQKHLDPIIAKAKKHSLYMPAHKKQFLMPPFSGPNPLSKQKLFKFLCATETLQPSDEHLLYVHLSDREKQCGKLYAAGHTCKDSANIMKVNYSTAQSYRQALHNKLQPSQAGFKKDIRVVLTKLNLLGMLEDVTVDKTILEAPIKKILKQPALKIIKTL